MRRAVLAIWLALAATCVWAQHEPASERGEKAAEANHEGGEGLTLWAWANFALLAGGLTYVFRKSAVPYFAQRTISIRKSMVDADEARADAERRISAVEARLANLPADVQALKDDAMAAARAEHHRVRQEIAAEIAKLRIHAEQDIASAGKAARAELKRYSATLAIGVAAEKVRARMNPAVQEALVRDFIRKMPGAVQ